jgi:hypothetical protein
LRDLIFVGKVEKANGPLLWAIEPAYHLFIYLIRGLLVSEVVSARVHPCLQIELAYHLHLLESSIRRRVLISLCDDWLQFLLNLWSLGLSHSLKVFIVKLVVEDWERQKEFLIIGVFTLLNLIEKHK